MLNRSDWLALTHVVANWRRVCGERSPIPADAVHASEDDNNKRTTNLTRKVDAHSLFVQFDIELRHLMAIRRDEDIHIAQFVVKTTASVEVLEKFARSELLLVAEQC